MIFFPHIFGFDTIGGYAFRVSFISSQITTFKSTNIKKPLTNPNEYGTLSELKTARRAFDSHLCTH
jgi:hypothetical protein